ncbi:histidinol-phosphate transaminase [Candidatus Sumerlaeota bacterium]|nr:histidinol-phosphate transaminase [Candidatus Sumerlaeota bacterium]
MKKSNIIQYRPHLEALFPYPAGKPIEEVQREIGLKSVVKLASNENPLGPSPKAIEASIQSLRDAHYYPEGSAYYLRHALAKKLRVKPEQLIFGNGTDELIILLMLTYLGVDEKLVISEKAFIRYQMAAMLNNSAFVSVPMQYSEPKKGQLLWKHDVKALAKAVDKKTRVICLSNPNNPLGSWIERDELEWLLEHVPKRTLVFYDEAYFEYAKGLSNHPDGLDYLDQYPNLIVSRTFSKAYGLAGFRVGYCVAHPELIQGFERVRPPFNVSRVAQAAATAALSDIEHVRNTVRLTREGIKRTVRELNGMGYNVIPSRANFVTIDVRRDSRELAQVLMQEGVIVRPLAGFMMPELMRVTIGLPEEMEHFMRALRKATM